MIGDAGASVEEEDDVATRRRRRRGVERKRRILAMNLQIKAGKGFFAMMMNS